MKTKRFFRFLFMALLVLTLTIPVEAAVTTNACQKHGGVFESCFTKNLTVPGNSNDYIRVSGFSCGNSFVSCYTRKGYALTVSKGGKRVSNDEGSSGNFVCSYKYNKKQKKWTVKVNGNIFGYTKGVSKKIYVTVKAGTHTYKYYVGKTNPSKCVTSASYKKISSTCHEKIVKCKKTGKVISRIKYKHKRNCRICR